MSIPITYLGSRFTSHFVTVFSLAEARKTLFFPGMFGRRSSRSIFTKLRELIWPRMGWRRVAGYYWHRLQRIPSSPESIAAGFACGAAASMMPLMGLHFVLSALFAFAVRGSIIASAFGTVVGNPWTFPLIWVGTYRLGSFFLGRDPALADERPFQRMFIGLGQALRDFDGAALINQVWPIWWPMMVGSLPVAVAAGFLTYWLLVRPIRAAYQRRARAILKKSA